MRRTKGFIILAIFLGGVIGSAATYIFGGLFPPGPVRSFFFKSLRIGFSHLSLSLGFISLKLSLWFEVSFLTIIGVFVMIYLLRKF
ncbi:hypothetical protein DRP53_04380 [candidate division WOR-3 bacterium]|uniref:DUF4321 domain-containing protein n=1 Tax=candidate division WOR-3 bacterium TaxID=2052148 RepID=A0A660SIR8_UNCW3|nr:MAG: hypothetical protein DRP53_04380 [candidate division WOR-3 bacterium]